MFCVDFFMFWERETCLLSKFLHFSPNIAHQIVFFSVYFISLNFETNHYITLLEASSVFFVKSRSTFLLGGAQILKARCVFLNETRSAPRQKLINFFFFSWKRGLFEVKIVILLIFFHSWGGWGVVSSFVISRKNSRKCLLKGNILVRKF